MLPDTPPCRCFRDFSIAEKAYYGIGGKVRFFCMPSSVAELAMLVSWSRSGGLPLAMLGLGSNMLFSDSDFPGRRSVDGRNAAVLASFGARVFL